MYVDGKTIMLHPLLFSVLITQLSEALNTVLVIMDRLEVSNKNMSVILSPGPA